MKTDLNRYRTPSRFVATACCFGLFVGLFEILSPICFAQTKPKPDEQTEKNSDEHVTLSDPPTEVVWRFAFDVTAIGDCKNVRAVTPLPVDWPEQAVQQVEETKSEEVETKVVDQAHNVRLLQIQIQSLKSDKVGTTFNKFVIKKREIFPPKDPSALKIPQKVKADLKPYLQESPFIETTNQKVKKLAASIALDSNKPAWNQVESIYDTIREQFPYEFDPTIRTCPEAIENKKGDCEELTSLFIAVCRIKKIPARAVWVPEHTYAEFYLLDSNGEGHWYPCQLAGTRSFGGIQEWRPILQKGDNFRIPLAQQPLRYIAPQLTAEAGACRIQWAVTPEVDANKDKKK